VHKAVHEKARTGISDGGSGLLLDMSIDVMI